MTESKDKFYISPHDSCSYCIPSCSRKKLRNHTVHPTENFNFGDALQSYFPLLENVFDFLNYNDLKVCMLVNDVWKDLAKKILKKRISASWISFVHPEKRLELSKHFNYGNVSTCIIFYDYHFIKLDKIICLHESTMERMTFIEYVAKIVVPKEVKHCLLSCSSLTPISVSNKERTQSKKTPRAIFQSISLPKIPNVNISMFHCSPDNPASINNILAKHIKPDEVIKCLLIFTQSNPYRHLTKFLNNVLQGENPANLALGGGIIKGVNSFLYSAETSRVHYAKDYFCISFQHKKNQIVDFNAASIVIPELASSSEPEFEEQLQILKLKSLNRENGVAFRICCNGKQLKEMETPLFNKHFPKIPLLGCDVDGEIGWNTCDINSIEIEPEQCEAIKKVKKDLPEVIHQWSTVFVLITWGKIINNGEFNV